MNNEPDNDSWRERATYTWVASVPFRAFGWEFLRRNRDLHSDWQRLRDQHGAEKGPSGFTIVAAPSAPDVAARWHLLGPLENPARDARLANVFWSPEHCPWILPVIAGPAESRDAALALTFSNCDCRTVVYEEPKTGRQHVLFTDQARTLQLDVRGGSIFTTQRLLPDVLLDAEYGPIRSRTVRQLTDLAKHYALRPQLYRPAQRAKRLADILQALDGELAGASRREIAVALFGEERVMENWRRRAMRDKVGNAVRTGIALMNGGYKKFLKYR